MQGYIFFFFFFKIKKNQLYLKKIIKCKNIVKGMINKRSRYTITHTYLVNKSGDHEPFYLAFLVPSFKTDWPQKFLPWYHQLDLTLSNNQNVSQKSWQGTYLKMKQKKNCEEMCCRPIVTNKLSNRQMDCQHTHLCINSKSQESSV